MGLCYSPAYLLSLWRFLGVKIWTTQAISMFFVTHFGSQIDQGPRNKNHVFSEENKLGEPEIVGYDDTRQDFLNPYPFFKQKIDVCVCEFWFVSIFDQLWFFVFCNVHQCSTLLCWKWWQPDILASRFKTLGLFHFFLLRTGPLNMAGGSKLTTKVFFRWHGTNVTWQRFRCGELSMFFSYILNEEAKKNCSRTLILWQLVFVESTKSQGSSTPPTCSRKLEQDMFQQKDQLEKKALVPIKP